MPPLQTLKHAGLVIKIYQDEDAQAPNEDMDLFGHIVTTGNRYWTPDEIDPAGFNAAKSEEGSAFVKVYMLVHGCTHVSCDDFNDRWDSAHVGYFYATAEEVRREFNGDIKKAEECLRAQIETWDQYLNGEVYYYAIENEDGDHIASCGGFYGEEYCITEAKSMAKWHSKQIAEELKKAKKIAEDAQYESLLV